MQVIWKLLYTLKSVSDKGTLYQLRNVVNRKNVGEDPTKDMNAHEDFFNLVTKSHALAAAMELFGMENLEDSPSAEIVPPSVWMLDRSERKSILATLCNLIADEYVHIHAHKSQDFVQEYASKVLGLGLLYEEFVDAIREGDGSRVLRCWKFLFLIFKENGRTNYSIEAFTFLAQHAFLLSPRQSQQLLQSRFINVHGLPGRNVSCDLHMEHLNRLLKTCIATLGPNKTPAAIVRLGKCIAPLSTTLDAFDSEHTVSSDSGSHKQAKIDKDLKLLSSELYNKAHVFKYSPGRKHSAFPTVTSRLFTNCETDKDKKLGSWMKEKWRKLIIGLL